MILISNRELIKSLEITYLDKFNSINLYQTFDLIYNLS